MSKLNSTKSVSNNPPLNVLQYIKGDLFEHVKTKDKNTRVLVPHIVNNKFLWGSGFVIAVSKYSKIPENIYMGVQNTKLSLNLGETQYCRCHNNVIVGNMVAQHETNRTNSKPIRYESLVRCMVGIRRYCESNLINEIWCPKFGSERAGGNWDFIEELIEEIWNSFTVKCFVI